MTENFFACLVAAFVGSSAMLVACMTSEDLRMESDLYCEMVMLYDATDGEYGWPDYKNEIDICGE